MDLVDRIRQSNVHQNTKSSPGLAQQQRCLFSRASATKRWPLLSCRCCCLPEPRLIQSALSSWPSDVIPSSLSHIPHSRRCPWGPCRAALGCLTRKPRHPNKPQAALLCSAAALLCAALLRCFVARALQFSRLPALPPVPALPPREAVRGRPPARTCFRHSAAPAAKLPASAISCRQPLLCCCSAAAPAPRASLLAACRRRCRRRKGTAASVAGARAAERRWRAGAAAG